MSAVLPDVATPLLAVQGLSVGIAPPEQARGFLGRPGPSVSRHGAGPHWGLAANHVSFTVHHGQTLCLVGESGCGKSITALSLLRLLPEQGVRILGGCAAFEGKDLLTMPAADLLGIRGNHIGMVFQDPSSSLNPVMRVGSQIAEGLRLHKKLGARAAQERAVEMLDKVGIPDPFHRAGDYPHQMSGGMRQRVMIAMALACSPRLLIADEPTTALDVTVQKQILELVKRLVDQSGSGLLLISHDLGVVASVADHVAVMYAGKIVESGPAKEVLTDPYHPYTRGLLQARKGLATRVTAQATHLAVTQTGSTSRQLEAIPGAVPSLWDMPQGCAFHPRCSQAMPRCRVEEPATFPQKSAFGTHRASCWLVEREL